MEQGVLWSSCPAVPLGPGGVGKGEVRRRADDVQCRAQDAG